MLYARALFFSGASRRWRLRAATAAPEVSFMRCYRLAWSRYVDVEAARGCLVSGELTPPWALYRVPRGLARYP